MRASSRRGQRDETIGPDSSFSLTGSHAGSKVPHDNAGKRLVPPGGMELMDDRRFDQLAMALSGAAGSRRENHGCRW